MPKFSPGTLIRGWMNDWKDFNDHRGRPEMIGTVINEDGNIINIRIVTPDPTARWYGAGIECPVWLDTAELANLFDLSKPPYSTRAGWPVSDVYDMGEYVSALVHHPGRGRLKMSYDKVTGQVRPGFEAPLDLVNTTSGDAAPVLG